MELKLITGTKLEHSLRKFYGLAPYDTWTNTCYADGILYKNLIEDYGEEAVKKITKILKPEIDERGVI